MGTAERETAARAAAATAALRRSGATVGAVTPNSTYHHPFNITLPAEITGLLPERACAPVFTYRTPHFGRSGVVLEVEGQRASVALHADPPARSEILTIGLDQLALRLDVSAGRVLAFEWLCRITGLPNRSLHLWNVGQGRWSFRSGGIPEEFVTFRSPGSPEASDSRPEVPGLGMVDWQDRTALPDGTSLADVLALRQIVLYLSTNIPRRFPWV